ARAGTHDRHCGMRGKLRADHARDLRTGKLSGRNLSVRKPRDRGGAACRTLIAGRSWFRYGNASASRPSRSPALSPRTRAEPLEAEVSEGAELGCSERSSDSEPS